MRNCIRCDTEMIEDLDIKEPVYCNMLRVTRPETYLSRLDKIQQYKGKE